MNQSHDEPNSTAVFAQGASVLEGLLTREQLAQQLDCSERTVIRYERAGMPFIAFGMLRRYHPPSVREWVLSKGRGHTVPKRGRPPGREGRLAHQPPTASPGRRG
jgi:hypothetical protein